MILSNFKCRQAILKKQCGMMKKSGPEYHEKQEEGGRGGGGERTPALLNGECLLWEGYYLVLDIQLSTTLDKQFHHTSTALLTCQE